MESLNRQLAAADATLKDTIEAMDPETARAQERARCRAIVWRHLSREVTGNVILEEIDNGMA